MEITICDLKSNSFEQDLLESVKNTGFVVLTHHSIDHGLIKESQIAWREFFLRDRSFKKLFINGNDTNLGYRDATPEITTNIKESFQWKLNSDTPLEAYSLTESLFFKLESLGIKILKILENEAGKNFVNHCRNSNNTFLNMLYYPPLNKFSKNVKDESTHICYHEYPNYLTVRPCASPHGLQFMDTAGDWRDVPYEKNSIVVNIGQMLHLASDGLFKSAMCRTINPQDATSDRVSMPLLIYPHSTTQISPIITAELFLQNRAFRNKW